MCILREQTKLTMFGDKKKWKLFHVVVVVVLETDGAHSFDENNLHKILTIYVITINELCRLDRSIRLKGILAYQNMFLYKGSNTRRKVFHTVGQIVSVHFATR